MNFGISVMISTEQGWRSATFIDCIKKFSQMILTIMFRTRSRICRVVDEGTRISSDPPSMAGNTAGQNCGPLRDEGPVRTSPLIILWLRQSSSADCVHKLDCVHLNEKRCSIKLTFTVRTITSFSPRKFLDEFGAIEFNCPSDQSPSQSHHQDSDTLFF